MPTDPMVLQLYNAVFQPSGDVKAGLKILGGVGVPPVALGDTNMYYLQFDATGASIHLYHKEGGVWVNAFPGGAGNITTTESATHTHTPQGQTGTDSVNHTHPVGSESGHSHNHNHGIDHQHAGTGFMLADGLTGKFAAADATGSSGHGHGSTSGISAAHTHLQQNATNAESATHTHVET